ncbi:MAG: TraR/DksA family transcriptional regulator [Bacteroidota bacterium]|nr:TraR/DksA family transcriptional regulator [Bacteroidota bacterium]
MAKVIKKKTAKPAAKKAKPAMKKSAAKPATKKAAAKPKPKTKVKAPAKKVATKGKQKIAAKPAKKATLKAKPLSKKVTAKPVKKAAKPAVKPMKKTIAKAKPALKKTAEKAKATPKAAVKPVPVKSIVKPEIKKPEQKSTMKPTQKTPTEKAQQVAVQRHIQEAKPLMEVSVVRYKDADLAIFKEVILKKIAKAKEEIDFYSDQIKNSSESETQFASIDDGSMTSERENMNQIVVRMQKLISHLESALVRIENKSYGICRETGRLIPKERLLVVPHATLSVEGKKLEKK